MIRNDLPHKITGSVDEILEELKKNGLQSHVLLVYPDLDALRDIYTHECKRHLENNEIVLLLAHYESAESVRFHLREIDVKVQEYEDKGILIIIDSSKAFFGSQMVDFPFFLDILSKYVKPLGKSGITVIADMGAFFHLAKLKELILYETAISPEPPAVEVTSGNNVKCQAVLCAYNVDDFAKLTEQQKVKVIDTHKKTLIIGIPR